MSTIERCLVIALLLAGPACAPGFHAEAPSGFAAYEGRKPYRAVSPSGVIYRVRELDNKPEALLPFWREALKKRMLDAGYSFVREGEIRASGAEGYLLELAAPVGQEDDSYLIAFFVRGKHLVLVESSGEVARFAAQREAVLSAIRGLRFTR